VPQRFDVLDDHCRIRAIRRADFLALAELRQSGVLLHLTVNLQETRKDHDGSIGAEDALLFIAGDGEIHRRLVQPRVHHLRSNGPLPDQTVDGQLVPIQSAG